MDLSRQCFPPKCDARVGLIWVSGAVPLLPVPVVGQPQMLPSHCMGDLISPSVLPLKCFHDNFKDNGMLLESMETVFRMQCHHENENLKSCLAWMTLLGSCYPMTWTHLRSWNTGKLVTSNTRTDAKTPNGGRGWHHTSNYPPSVYFNLKYVVKNEEFYLFIFSNAQGIPEGVLNAGSNFTPSSTAFSRNIWKVKQSSKLRL